MTLASVAAVLDSNVVLDLLVFRDASAQALQRALAAGDIEWLATAAMRDELARVLGYPKIMTRLAAQRLRADDVLAQFDALVRLVAVAAKAGVTCRDPDDQKFVDLAVAQRCLLLSKDGALLCLRRRLAALGVQVQTLVRWQPGLAGRIALPHDA